MQDNCLFCFLLHKCLRLTNCVLFFTDIKQCHVCCSCSQKAEKTPDSQGHLLLWELRCGVSVTQTRGQGSVFIMTLMDIKPGNDLTH